MNRFDEFAVEESLLIKERLPGTVAHALSVGPKRVNSTIRRALEMGADHGIHILYPDAGYISPYTVATLITTYARTKDYDLILAGIMAEDDMACQTGQLIAALMDLPYTTSVISSEIDDEAGEIVVGREIEGGRRLMVRFELPAVLTIQSGINTPRYPSLSNVMRARSQQHEVIRAEDLGIPQVRETCAGLRLPDSASMGTFIEGSPREKARKMIQVLHEKAFLP
ncbi:MAG TPA: electron transfer flavoprotein subunit beta/FixA family protein [Desulfomonilia bacterium]|nr:electron transfer flavoprotein subunit beta/FixA family protein [Desulfomonilia bacterium]